MVCHRLRGAVAVDQDGAALDRGVGTERQQRLIVVSGLSYERADDTDERMVVIAEAGAGDGGNDVEPWHADCLCDARLVLPEKAPQCGTLSSKTEAMGGQAQTRSVYSDASRCRPASTSAAVSTTVTPGRSA
jgi:hypothetical protein